PSRHVGDQAYPTDPGSAATRLHGLPNLVCELQIGKVHPGARSKGVIAPRASIDVQQLILSIAWVEFVFQLHQSVVVDGPQEALRQGLQERQFNGFYERAGPAELGRVLATPPDDHAADRPAS